MRKFIYICIIMLNVFVAAPAPAQDWTPLGGVVLTPSVAHDQQAGATAAGIDVNIIVAALNAGITHRHWDGDVAGWDGTAILDHETTIYFGLGFLNVLQVQAGYSGSGASMRVRSDLPLFQKKFPLLPSLYAECNNNDAEPCNEINVPRKTLILSPFVEFTPFEDNHKTVYGLGVGMVF